MKFLIVEDEKNLRDSLEAYLKNSGHICEIAPDYKSALDKIITYSYDCLIVDVCLPDGSGMDIVKEIKNINPDSGVIIISAKNSLDDKIQGLDTGADDYLTKPFHLSELNARVNSIIRRRNFKGKHILEFNEIKVMTDEKTVLVNDKPVSLTKKEYELLIYFITNQGKVLTKEAIADNLWGDNADMANSLDFIYSHIKNVRKKITDAGADDYIKAVYGMGYKFTQQD